MIVAYIPSPNGLRDYTLRPAQLQAALGLTETPATSPESTCQPLVVSIQEPVYRVSILRKAVFYSVHHSIRCVDFLLSSKNCFLPIDIT